VPGGRDDRPCAGADASPAGPATALPYARSVPNSLRQSVERASLPLLTRLTALPRPVPFAVMLALLVVGALIGGPVGFVLMGVATLTVAWLLYLSWPRLTGPERLMRGAVVLLAAALAVVQLFPRP
jgi:hypothetical protein